MYEVKWTEQAKEDVKNILLYLKEVAPQAAIEYGTAFQDAAKMLAFMPEISRVWEVNNRFRCCTTARPYKILYEVDTQNKRVIIASVVHGRRKDNVPTIQ